MLQERKTAMKEDSLDSRGEHEVVSGHCDKSQQQEIFRWILEDPSSVWDLMDKENIKVLLEWEVIRAITGGKKGWEILLKYKNAPRSLMDRIVGEKYPAICVQVVLGERG